ncbi:hypothetical protein MPTK1_2g23060 [Marchantia polymorpha subsp. ruderalis]|uniref:Uncharacterized protein n=1 Tax=Marchantia polymorpha TaxID=3197 RepID=A0A2R6WN36_MARPO|nr:hypothetical protein MARPO_0072s0025 [Marchantia polymorpha]BBN03383.1 hypothetical protein Mp_2g23060 [Marchantia polymorpha subsp. ruderalis]|eukprot:PTQ35268.1 hypothetical protein MARPO_0072s0025 [Marchantia polymorpha]
MHKPQTIFLVWIWSDDDADPITSSSSSDVSIACSFLNFPIRLGSQFCMPPCSILSVTFGKVCASGETTMLKGQIDVFTTSVTAAQAQHT